MITPLIENGVRIGLEVVQASVQAAASLVPRSSESSTTATGANPVGVRSGHPSTFHDTLNRGDTGPPEEVVSTVDRWMRENLAAEDFPVEVRWHPDIGFRVDASFGPKQTIEDLLNGDVQLNARLRQRWSAPQGAGEADWTMRVARPSS